MATEHVYYYWSNVPDNNFYMANSVNLIMEELKSRPYATPDGKMIDTRGDTIKLIRLAEDDIWN
jgi:hypothetical protein